MNSRLPKFQTFVKSIKYLTLRKTKYEKTMSSNQGRNQVFTSEGAIFMKCHSMTSSCLFNQPWYNFFANGHIYQ